MMRVTRIPDELHAPTEHEEDDPAYLGKIEFYLFERDGQIMFRDAGLISLGEEGLALAEDFLSKVFEVRRRKVEERGR